MILILNKPMEKLLKLIKKDIFFWGIGFLLIFIPLYPKFPLFPVSGTYVHIRLEDIFVALILGLFIIHLLAKKDFSLLKENITKLAFFYFGIGFLAVLNGIFIAKNIVPHLAFLHWVRRIEYLSLLFVAYYSLDNIKQLKTYGWLTFFSTLGVIFYGLGQKFFGWPVVSTMNKEFSKGMILKLTWWARVNSTFAGHYDLAAFLVIILCLTFSAFLIIKRKSLKIPIVIFGVFSYYLLILTASRISFIAYLLGGGAVLYLAKKKRWIFPFLFFSLLGMFFSEDLGQRYAATFKIDLSFLSGKTKIKTEEVAYLPIATPTPTEAPLVAPQEKKIVSKVGSTPTPTPTLLPEEEATPPAYFEPTALAVGRSTDIRLKVEWPRAIRAFLKNPLLGTGYSSITLATDNDYLRMLGETGLLGTLAFFALIIAIAKDFYLFLDKSRFDQTEKLIICGVVGASIGYFVNAAFIDVLEASKVAFLFWIMIGLGLKVVRLKRSNFK